MSTYKWVVTGERKMNCGGCTGSVKAALSQMAGVERVEAEVETQLIEVEGADSLDAGQVVTTLADLGYTVSEA